MRTRSSKSRFSPDPNVVYVRCPKCGGKFDETLLLMTQIGGACWSVNCLCKALVLAVWK
jgi:hypothetical protein